MYRPIPMPTVIPKPIAANPMPIATNPMLMPMPMSTSKSTTVKVNAISMLMQSQCQCQNQYQHQCKSQWEKSMPKPMSNAKSIPMVKLKVNAIVISDTT